MKTKHNEIHITNKNRWVTQTIDNVSKIRDLEEHVVANDITIRYRGLLHKIHFVNMFGVADKTRCST